MKSAEKTNFASTAIFQTTYHIVTYTKTISIIKILGLPDRNDLHGLL